MNTPYGTYDSSKDLFVRTVYQCSFRSWHNTIRTYCDTTVIDFGKSVSTIVFVCHHLSVPRIVVYRTCIEY